MIDPVSAFAVAVSSFNAVKKLVEAGREVEDVVGQLGKWFSAVADHRTASDQVKNPPIFRKLLHAGSIEQQALEITIHEQRFIAMEKELREMIVYRYGTEVYIEMMKTRRRLRAEREQMAKRQAMRRKDFIEQSLLWVLLAALLAVSIWLGILFFDLLKERK